MISFLKIILLVGTFFLSFNNTSNGIDFMDKIYNAYDKYYIVEDEKIMVGDFTLIFGQVDNKYYLSCFLYNDGTQNKHLVKIIVNDQKLTSYVHDGGVVEGFGLELDSTDTFKVYISDKQNDVLLGSYNVSNLIDDLVNDYNVGLGTKEFPKNKRETDFIKTIKLYIYVFVLLSFIFIGILIFLYRYRVGRFSERYKQIEPNIFEKVKDVDDSEIIDATFTIEKDNKQEIMDKLFEEYRHGDITEEELNERLKKLWWKE